MKAENQYTEMNNKCNLCEYKKKGYTEQPCAFCSENMTIENRFTAKEPELMTFLDAWEKAKDRDIVDHTEVDTWVKKDKKNEPFKIKIGDYIEKKWQIIPAETEILTANRWIQSKYKSFRENEYPKIHAAFEAGENNQKKTHKELREAAENVLNQLNHGNSVMDVAKVGLENALKNLNHFGLK